MVFRDPGDVQPDREHAISKFTWDFIAAPAAMVVYLAGALYVLWKLLTFPVRYLRRMFAAGPGDWVSPDRNS